MSLKGLIVEYEGNNDSKRVQNLAKNLISNNITS